MTPFAPIPHLLLLAILTLAAFGLGMWKWRSQPAVLLIISGTLLCAIGVGLCKPAWGFNPPLSWLLIGRRESYVIAFAGPLLLFGLMAFVRSALLRGVVIFAVMAVVVVFGFLPVVAVF